MTGQYGIFPYRFHPYGKPYPAVDSWEREIEKETDREMQ
jgi:hypothetical protein